MWSSLFDRLASLVSAARLPRQRVRLTLPGRGPMRVVYDKAVVHETYSFRARVLQRTIRMVFKPVLRYTPINERTFAAIRAIDGLSEHRKRSPHITFEVSELGGVRVESMRHRYGPESEMTLLYLHGGGFFSGSIVTHRRICERLALKTGATVVSVDYVQLPEGSIAESVQDAISAYAALVESSAHPDKIVVAGDSAGGYLTMKVAELASRRGLPAPAALLGLTPAQRRPGPRGQGRRAHHPGPRRLPADPADRAHPGAVAAGGRRPDRRVCLAASLRCVHHVADVPRRSRGRAAAARGRGHGALLSERGVEVETHLWRKQVHAFPVLVDVVPESEMAIQLAADFARRAVGELDRDPIEDPASHEEVMTGELVPDQDNSAA